MGVWAGSVLGMEETGQAPVRVAVTHPFVQEWVERVGGEEVAVILVSESDFAGLEGAQLLYETGLGMEPWLDEALASGENPQLRRVVLTEGMPLLTQGEAYWLKMEPPHPNPESLPQCCRSDAAETNKAWGELVVTYASAAEPVSDRYDPNLWFNPRNAMSAGVVISETLYDARPEAGDDFDRGMAVLMEDLVGLDGWVKSRIRDIPMEKRILITDGGSFRYYAQAYGLIAPEAEQAEGVVVLAEAGSPDELCACEECTCPGCVCPAGAVLFTSSLGMAEPTVSTYDALMRKNTETLVEALQAE